MNESEMINVEVCSGAWYGDRKLTLGFPASWDVRVVGQSPGPPLDTDEMRQRLCNPIGASGLATLARNQHSAAIVIDDISRPTPTAEILPLVLAELEAGGVPASRVRIFIAAGGHEQASGEDNLKKVGAETARRVAFEPHDPDGDLVRVGVSPSGIPLHINRGVMEADLKLGIGSICPHEGAGFSGGSKILVPGVAGTQTARYLHDFLRGAKWRGGSRDNELRRELDAIAAMLGLNFIVNVILDHRRRVVELFAGDPRLAHEEGTRVAAEKFVVTPVRDAEIVVANTYPFDANLWFAPWGFWPLFEARPGATKVVLADGSQGLGSHRLKPAEISVMERAWRRLMTIRLRFVWKQARHLFTSLRRTRSRKVLQFMLLCPKLAEEEVKKRFSEATHFRSWEELLVMLRKKHGEGAVKVAVYPCAPLQVPREPDGDS